jgi:hypothetical protein
MTTYGIAPLNKQNKNACSSRLLNVDASPSDHRSGLRRPCNPRTPRSLGELHVRAASQRQLIYFPNSRPQFYPKLAHQKSRQ